MTITDEMVERASDPDETEGRQLYRQAANALARAQISIANRTAKYRLEAALSGKDRPND